MAVLVGTLLGVVAGAALVLTVQYVLGRQIKKYQGRP
jgi:hypothetical protein